MAIKVIAIGPKAYIRDRMNIYDVMIVIISTIDLTLQIIIDKSIET